jgi:TRAP-type C4-dicarboxylate transport system permease small subunit
LTLIKEDYQTLKILNFIQDKVVTSIAVILFIISCTWMLIESISRQFFSKSFSFTEELVVFSLIWAIFLTLGQSGKEGNHIFVDLFVMRFGKRMKKITAILSQLIGFLYGCFLIYVGINYVQHLLDTGITSNSSLRLPMSYVFLVVPIGMLFFALYYFQSLLKEIPHKKEIEKSIENEAVKSVEGGLR